jgi:regulator of replication initiation timing
MSKRMDNWTILFLVLILIGSIGGVLFSIKQLYNAQDNKNEIIENLKSNTEELKEKNEDLKVQISELKNANDTLSLELKSRDEKISVQNKKIEDLNNRIYEKSDFIQNTLFGKGFCYLDIVSEIISNGSKDDAIVRFRIINEFDFPLYNVSIEVFDFDKLESKVKTINGVKSIQTKDYAESQIFSKIYPEINPSFSVTLAGFPIDYLNIKRYYIKITHRNGTYWQRVLFHLENKGIYSLYDVIETKTNKTVKSDSQVPEDKTKELKNSLSEISVDDIKMTQW